MKTKLRYSLVAAVLATGVNFNVLPGSSPGQVNFGGFSPPGGGDRFVEVWINSKGDRNFEHHGIYKLFSHL